MIKNFKKKIKKDSGLSITIFMINMILLIFVMTLFSIEYIKIGWAKEKSYNVATQSAQTAIKYQNLVGGLDALAVSKAINEYRIQNTTKEDIYLLRGVGPGRTCPAPTINIYFSKGRGNKNRTLMYTSNNYQIPSLGFENNLGSMSPRVRVYDTITIESIDYVKSQFNLALGGCIRYKTAGSATIATSHDYDN